MLYEVRHETWPQYIQFQNLYACERQTCFTVDGSFSYDITFARSVIDSEKVHASLRARQELYIRENRNRNFQYRWNISAAVYLPFRAKIERPPDAFVAIWSDVTSRTGDFDSNIHDIGILSLKIARHFYIGKSSISRSNAQIIRTVPKDKISENLHFTQNRFCTEHNCKIDRGLFCISQSHPEEHLINKVNILIAIASFLWKFSSEVSSLIYSNIFNFLIMLFCIYIGLLH